VVASDGVGSARLRLRVWSPLDDPDGPAVLIELVAGDRDTGQRLRLDLSVPQLDRLRQVLLHSPVASAPPPNPGRFKLSGEATPGGPAVSLGWG
jgi:hypothetical protein